MEAITFIVTIHPLYKSHTHILTQNNNMRLSKTKKTLLTRPDSQPLLYISEEEWTNYYPHSFTSIKLQTFIKHKPMRYVTYNFLQLTSVYFCMISQAFLNYA
jgi:hypothetical protein